MAVLGTRKVLDTSLNIETEQAENTKATGISKVLRKDMSNRGHLFVLPNIFICSWECDLFSVTKSGYTNEFEIKITKEDYKKDFEKRVTNYNWGTESEIMMANRGRKHDVIKSGKRTNKFWFVVPENLISVEEIPDYAGLLYARGRKGSEYMYFDLKKDAPFLHKQKFDDNPKLIKDIALKCYYRITQE